LPGVKVLGVLPLRSAGASLRSGWQRRGGA